jgi:ketosteroid isomerase-like protein
MKNIVMLVVVAALAAACQQPQSPPDPRIAALVDRQAIDQLVAGDYPRALDASDWDAYVATYAEDGELVLLGNSSKGRAAIKSFLAAQPAGAHVIHVISNLSYTINGDSATGGAYWQDIGNVNGAPGVVVAGHYDDSLRKVNGAWKFTKRSIVIDFPPAGGLPAPAAAPSGAAGKP